MINKNRPTATLGLNKQEEYKAVAKDLQLVLWLNLCYLAAILAVYFTDQKYHYLMRIFSGLWK